MLRLILHLALRNLRRQLRRSLLTGSVIVIGLWALVFVAALADGIRSNTVKLMIDSSLAHVHVYPQNRSEDDPFTLDTTLPAADLVEANLKLPRPWQRSRQIQFMAQLYLGGDKMWVPVFAVDPVAAQHTFPNLKDLSSLHAAGPDLAPLALGKDLARLFGAKTGDSVTLLCRSQSGEIAALDFTVCRLLNSGNPAIDKQALFIPLASGRILTGLGKGYTDYYYRLPSKALADNYLTRTALSQTESAWQVRVAPYQEETAKMLGLINIDLRAMKIIVCILFLIAMTGMTNTTLIAVHERKKEIGLLQALGWSRASIVGLFCAESILLGMVAALLGLALGGGTVTYVHHAGIDFGRLTQDVPITLPSLSILYPALRVDVLLLAFSGTVLLSGLAGLWPAWQAVQLTPVQALRGDA